MGTSCEEEQDNIKTVKISKQESEIPEVIDLSLTLEFKGHYIDENNQQ